MADKKDRSWEKRLQGKPNTVMIDFVESLSLDRRLYKYDIAGSIVHAQMLAQQGILKQSEYQTIRKGLVAIAEDIEIGRFKFNKTDEDIHMAIERALIQRIGEIGAKLHTGRSRNDQVATDIRLWTRDQIEILQQKIAQLQHALLDLADQYHQDVIPAYTHLQRAQPVVISAYLLSFVEQYERDYQRLGHCRDLMNVSPLGSGAVAGSTLAIDRQSTASSLGFSSITGNSLDAVSDRDFCAEFIFDCAMIAMHLSRFAEDWILYSSSEFGFIHIDDTLCTSSSMMPQKRNPDALELIRAKTGAVYGALMGILTILKAQPSGYNRDLQEDKRHVFCACDTVTACLDMTQAVITHSTFSTAHIAAGLNEGFLDATALAEYLVEKGIPFRQAHGMVGTLVTMCEKNEKRLADLTLEEFQAQCTAIQKDVYKRLGSQNVVGQYRSEGAGGFKQVKKQITMWKKRLQRR